MIAKLETGNGFGGALRYDVRAGKGTAKELARVLDADGVSVDYDIDGNLLLNPKQVGFDFRQQAMGYIGSRRIRKPVYHWALSYHPKDNVSEEQMVQDAKEFLKRIGFENTQYVMTAHYDKEHRHLHIVTNVVDNNGRRISTQGLIDKAHAAAAAITKERGYTWGEKTKKESITKERMHKPHERARKTLEPVIREVLATSTSLRDFQERLIMDHDVMCNFTISKDGKRGRISFCYEFEGQMHSFNGSSVARDLSFGQISKIFEKKTDFAEQFHAALMQRSASIGTGSEGKEEKSLETSAREAFSAFRRRSQIVSVFTDAPDEKSFRLSLASLGLAVREITSEEGVEDICIIAAGKEGFIIKASQYGDPYTHQILDAYGRIYSKRLAYKTRLELEKQRQQSARTTPSPTKPKHSLDEIMGVVDSTVNFKMKH